MEHGDRRVQRVQADGDQPRGGHEEAADDGLAAFLGDECRHGGLGRRAPPGIAVDELHGPPEYAAHGVDLGSRKLEAESHLGDIGLDQFIDPLGIHLADEDPDLERSDLGDRREPGQRAGRKCRARAGHELAPCYGHSCTGPHRHGAPPVVVS